MTTKAARGDTGKYTIRLRNASGVCEGTINATVLGLCFIFHFHYKSDGSLVFASDGNTGFVTALYSNMYN